MNEFISKRLKDLREKHQWTQAEVAQKLNIETGTYQKMEKGVSQSWGHYLTHFLEIYNIEIPEFFEGMDGKNFNHQVISNNNEANINSGYGNFEAKNMECDFLKKQVELLQDTLQKIQGAYDRAIEDVQYWKKKAEDKN